VRKALSFCAGICVGLLLSGTAAAAAAKPGRQVQDPHYGDVLFYFYQDKFFDAITRLMAACQVGRAQAHAEDGDLLMAGMLLSYGQHDQAAAIFRTLLDDHVKPPVRDRAWFYLARIGYDRGSLEQAEEALGHIGKFLPPRLDAERQMLHAQVLMEQGRFDDAATILKDWKGPADWAAYARFNLGVALVRANRIDEGLPFLEQAGTTSSDDAEQQALSDRANVALGFAAIQAQKPAAAVAALNRVRLEGPYSSKALLGLGWAKSALDQDRDALVPWFELQKRDLIDPAVQESFLAVPYALARLHANGQAANQYEAAIRKFEDETQRLDTAIANIRAGKLLASLLADEKPEAQALGGDLKLEKPAKTEESRYLSYLLASRPFQEGLKNYRDLRFVGRNLGQWSQDVAVFSDMLTNQKLAYDQRQPRVQQALQTLDLAAIERHRAEDAHRLEKIEAEQSAAGLANAAELAQLARIDSLQKRIDALGDSPEADAARDQLRVLRGVLQWDLDHDFKLRLWRQKRAQAALDDAVAAAQAQRAAVDAAQRAIPDRVSAFQRRIEQQTPRIGDLKARSETLLQRQQAFLQALAIDELESYKTRLHQYTVEARFALAQIYNRASTQATPQAAPPAGAVQQSPEAPR